MNNRKDDHVRLALEMHQQDASSDFDQVQFVYDALPSINLEDVDISTSIEGLNLESPFYINAMTGGSEKTKEINEKLAIVAQSTNLPIASGSLSAALKNNALVDSFTVLRSKNNGLVFANIGAEYGAQEAQRAIEFLSADALQIHINAVQEIIMPEGDRMFSHWEKNIKEIKDTVKVPVIVKEVGFGMSQSTIGKLVELGVKNIDISGRGGTNFAMIENERRVGREFHYMSSFGLSTVKSLLEARGYKGSVTIIASGGIRHPLDIVKAVALGADAVGVSGVILNHVERYGVEETILMINQWKTEIRSLMTLLGCKTISELQDMEVVFSTELYQYIQQRDL